jgi:hypothetical protein
MGQAIPRQHPAVVLRSQFNKLRALVAIALVAVAGLTVAVVILANDSDEISGSSSAAPVGSINYGDSTYVNPSTGFPTAPFPPLEQPLQNRIDGIRYDGGPEEGSGGVVATPQPSVTPETEPKDEAGTAAAIGGSELRGSKASDPGTQLDEDAEEARRTDPHGPASALR